MINGDFMRVKQFKKFACDFETTVYSGQEYTEVWSSACVEIGTPNEYENVNIFHSIREQWDYFLSLNENIIAYYHNLKFDGMFWLSFLLLDLKMKQAYIHFSDSAYQWIETKNMQNNSFKYSISEMGQFYYIIIKINNKTIEIRDSLKLLPFSLRKISKSFNTKHKKLEMEYNGFRFAGCNITDDEKKYIANDVLVLKEALEIIFADGHNKLTIGSCCLAEFKKTKTKTLFENMFPNLDEFSIDPNKHKYETADKYIRKSYRGGWCYLVDGKQNKIIKNGLTLDVNSLYPSVMHSISGNRYPVGLPQFWSGNYIPDNALSVNSYYFVRIKTRFYLKSGFLPFIQIKNNLRFRGNVSLKTSDYFDEKTGKYYTTYFDRDGVEHDTRVELVLTMTDYELIKKHYKLVDFEILDGCYFNAQIGIFDRYIDKYRKIKMTTTGAKRELAKLFLNNLYGKMATNTNSSFKIAFLKDDKSIGFINCYDNSKKPVYIPVGTAITSYARYFTITAAQLNYYGSDKKGFVYSDTDSVHIDLPIEKIRGIKINDTEFCCWKLETNWDYGIFVRQKTYIEHVVSENQKPIEKPYYNVKCAGMPERCKNLFIKSMGGDIELGKLTDDEKKFLKTNRKINDFGVGLEIPSKLVPKRIRGGVLLTPTTYKIR